MSEVTPWLAFATAGQLDAADISQQLFHNRLVASRARYQQCASWETQLATLEGAHPLIAYWGEQPGAQDAFISNYAARVFGYLWLTGGQVTVRCAGENPTAVRELMAELAAAIPKTELSEDTVVPVTFWSLSAHGPRERTRMIDVASWADVRFNYTQATRSALGPMVEAFTPGKGGQLVLWQGPPGTGKTWALRALAWEWRDWCRLHYIADPDQFFAERAEYMLEVLLHDDDGAPSVTTHLPDPEPAAAREQWRLLVLEDTGELLAADAKERTGQGLSRLLNVVDGLIGQGLRVIVLVTTNEELRALHPAITRPGRCAAQIAFRPFDGHEAAEWLEARDSEDHVNGGTLAELYAALEDREARASAPVGFA